MLKLYHLTNASNDDLKRLARWAHMDPSGMDHKQLAFQLYYWLGGV